MAEVEGIEGNDNEMECDVRHAMADSSSSLFFLPPSGMDFASSHECLNFTNNIQTSLQTRSPIGASILLMSYFSFILFYGFIFLDFRKPCHSATIFHCHKKKLAIRGCSNNYLLIFLFLD